MTPLAISILVLLNIQPEQTVEDLAAALSRQEDVKISLGMVFLLIQKLRLKGYAVYRDGAYSLTDSGLGVLQEALKNKC